MNTNLPISGFEKQIIAAVENNLVVIIKAETGAGKSTQVPQFLMKAKGLSKIVVTQPRRIAATSIAQRVAEEIGCELGGVVGYRTAIERKDSNKTRLLFCTDGLELVSELFSGDVPEGVLVIDEAHEWNLNIELLIAWARYQLEQGARYRVVIMSATLDTKLLIEHFDGKAVLIEVPGRTFPVTEKKRERPMVEEISTLLKEGRNVLVFQPGKMEISKTVSVLINMDVDAEVFPLHAETPLMDQVPCFLTYRRPKCVVATNVAQTSITISDIDAVVDSGLERRSEYIDGVEGLYIRPISLADSSQRKGRAGRVKPGIYIDYCPTERERRVEFPKADILSLPLEKVILQLAKAGVQIENIRFCNQPSTKRIQEARNVLLALGCTDRKGNLTAIGTIVASLPISARLGRMIVEGARRNVLSETILLASVMEQGGVIRERRGSKEKTSTWSDAFAELAAFVKGHNLSFEQFEQHGIDPGAFTEAQILSRRLQKKLRHNIDLTSFRVSSEKDVVCSIYAGLVDRLYRRGLVKGYKDSAGNMRNLPTWSVVNGAEQIVGLPLNLQVRSEFGPKTLRLITMATRVDEKLFSQVLTGQV